MPVSMFRQSYTASQPLYGHLVKAARRIAKHDDDIQEQCLSAGDEMICSRTRQNKSVDVK